jgi:Iap family predicted aminopeptidase
LNPDGINIRAMVNIDMILMPSGFNTNGFSEFKPFLENVAKKLNGFNLADGVTETMGTNTDYVSFYREGIPVISIISKSNEPRYEYAHELGDTFDKVNKKYLSDAAAVVSILIRELAIETDIKTHRRNEDEITTQCKKYGVLDILLRQKEWPWINRPRHDMD